MGDGATINAPSCSAGTPVPSVAGTSDVVTFGRTGKLEKTRSLGVVGTPVAFGMG